MKQRIEFSACLGRVEVTEGSGPVWRGKGQGQQVGLLRRHLWMVSAP